MKIIHKNNLKYVHQTYAVKSSEKNKNIGIIPLEGLLSALNYEICLSLKVKSIKVLPEDVKSLIKKDLTEHPDDYHKIYIDVLKALNKNGGDFRNPDEDTEITEPNGKNAGVIDKKLNIKPECCCES